MLIDLRSDTVTKPTEAMRLAMARAEVGDDVFGEDPTVNRLQERVADLLGKEAGLFLPSGTMANAVGLGVLTRPGDEIICDQSAHCICFESGGLAALWGVQARTLASDRGLLDPEDVEAAIRPSGDSAPRTRVIEIENTHNRGGGAVYPLERVAAIGAVAARRGLYLHLDGARLLNACAASQVRPSEYARHATTVSMCLSKGLGAPAGSVLAASKDLVKEARRLRKRLGGAMRQSGILAAAGLFALDHHVERLREDHANARRLAEGLRSAGAVLRYPVETNMVFASFEAPAAGLVQRFAREGVLADPEGSKPNLVRFVTHLDVSTSDVDEALVRIQRALASA